MFLFVFFISDFCFTANICFKMLFFVSQYAVWLQFNLEYKHIHTIRNKSFLRTSIALDFFHKRLIITFT